MSNSTTPRDSFPPVDDPAISTLTDEISDVIEAHSRGLDSEAIATVVEDVAAELENGPGERFSADELKRAIRKFLREHTADLDRDSATTLLRDIADDLATGSIAPELELLEQGPPHRLTLRFASAFGLKYHIPKILDARGYFLESELPLTHLDDIEIRVESVHAETSVLLVGSVVRTAPNGFAVRVAPATPQAGRELEELPETIRRTRLAERADG